MAERQMAGQKGEHPAPLCVAFMAARRMLRIHHVVDHRQHRKRLRGRQTVIGLFGLQTLQPLPPVDPVIQIESVAQATTPDTKGLLIALLSGDGQRPQVGDATIAGMALLGAGAHAAALDYDLFPAARTVGI